jgi:hypothetical protein
MPGVRSNNRAQHRDPAQAEDPPLAALPFQLHQSQQAPAIDLTCKMSRLLRSIVDFGIAGALAAAGSRNDDGGYRRQPDDALGNAPEQRMSHARPAVRAEQDQVGVSLFDRREDLLPGRAEAQQRARLR